LFRNRRDFFLKRNRRRFEKQEEEISMSFERGGEDFIYDEV